jgi:hypothetical protein
MTKYAALGDYLSRQKAGLLQMSFADIERIIGGSLPASQRYPAWWSNNPMNNTMTRVWLDAGFQTEQVDIVGRRLTFRRISGEGARSHNLSAAKKNVGEHPLFARILGTAQVPEGVDLTAPADPDWGNLSYGADATKRSA